MPSVLLIPDLQVEHWPSMDRYAWRLVRGLEEHAPDITLRLSTEISTLTVSDDGAPSTKPVETGELRRYLARYWSYPRRVRKLPGQVVHVLDHSYAHMTRAKRDTPSVVTVHDLLPLITVRRKARRTRERMRNRLLQYVLECLTEADAFIVSTAWLKDELAEWLGRDDRIHVVPFGVDDAFFDTGDQSRAEIRDGWHVPESAFVVLHVGSVGRRKNFSGVIAAVDGVRKTGIDAWLVQVGGHLTAEHRAEIAARRLEPYAVSLGPLREVHLRQAYRAADVLLFPSLYEGFGFPVLEAMASGLPAVTSRAGGLAEVAGDAAVTVESREVEPFSAAVARIAQDADWRAAVVERGARWARRFRWGETAKRTALVYRSLA